MRTRATQRLVHPPEGHGRLSGTHFLLAAPMVCICIICVIYKNFSDQERTEYYSAQKQISSSLGRREHSGVVSVCVCVLGKKTKKSQQSLILRPTRQSYTKILDKMSKVC